MQITNYDIESIYEVVDGYWKLRKVESLLDEKPLGKTTVKMVSETKISVRIFQLHYSAQLGDAALACYFLREGISYPIAESNPKFI